MFYSYRIMVKFTRFNNLPLFWYNKAFTGFEKWIYNFLIWDFLKKLFTTTFNAYNTITYNSLFFIINK